MAAPAWAVDLWVRVKPLYDRLAVWHGYEDELRTLAIYGIGIAIYTALVFAFYQNLSKRRPFHLKLSDRPRWAGRFGRFVERALIFPLTSFVYFSVLAIALFVLAKETIGVQTLMLIAMSVVVAVRVTVYISEAMSNDLSKLVPLSLLGVLLVDPGYLKLSTAWLRVGDAIDLWPLLGRYFLLFIALEAVMATTRASILKAGSASKGVAQKVRRKPAPPSKTEAPGPTPAARPAPGDTETSFTVHVKGPATPPQGEKPRP